VSFIICSPHQIPLSIQGGCDGQGYGGICEGEMLRGFWREKLEEGDHLENLGIDGKILLKWILNRLGGHSLD